MRRATSTYAGLFLVSAAGLLFQVAQTRLFSASLGYHLTYLVISVSLLGVGAGASCSALIDRRSTRPSRAALSLALGGSCLAALFVQTRLDPLTAGLPAVVATAYLLGSLPLVFSSWVVVRSLRERPELSGRLYAADLAGAAAGGLGAFLGISPLGVPALYAVAATLAVAAAVAFRPRSWRVTAMLPVSIGAVLALFAWGEQLAPPRIGPDKDPMFLEPGVTRAAVQWDPVARVDVLVRSPDDRRQTGPGTFFVDAGYDGPWPTSLGMFLDLGVSTPVVGGDVSALRSSLLAAPYAILDGPAVLVIGPGGGIDIHNALAHHASRVDAVEVNRSVVSLMRSELSSSSNDVYQRPGVRVFEDEARSFVRRSHDRYDLMVMTVVDSYAALASGSYALSESYLYTAEAFYDYAAHLTEGGLVAVGRWYRDPPIEMLRTAQVAASGWQRAGLADAARHLVVLRYRNFGLLIAGRRPFEIRDMDRLRAFAAAHGFSVAYDPLSPSEPFRSSIAGASSSWVTDDRPFFFADEPTRRTGQEIVPVAYGILYLALLSAAILSYVLILLPQRFVARNALGTAAARRATIHAAAVGFGFIAAEMILLQRLTLYLGQPALALSLGLAGLLLGAAIGAAASTRVASLARTGALTAALLALVLILLPLATDATLDRHLSVRIAVALIGVGVAGVPLGAVFPRILMQAAAADLRLVQWAWAVNGVASVVGSIFAVGIAIAVGFTGLGIAAVACYVAVALTGQAADRAEDGPSLTSVP